jgi:hypothetical protein
MAVPADGTKVTVVQMRTRSYNTKPDLAAIMPQQSLTTVLRTAAGCTDRLALFGREDRGRKRFDANSPRRVGPQQVAQIESHLSSKCLCSAAKRFVQGTFRIGVPMRKVLSLFPPFSLRPLFPPDFCLPRGAPPFPLTLKQLENTQVETHLEASARLPRRRTAAHFLRRPPSTFSAVHPGEN